MTNFKRILVALMATMTMTMAGGDIAPVTELAPVEVTPATKDFYVGLSTIAAAGTDYNTLNWFQATTVGAQVGLVAYRSGDISVSLEGRYATDTQHTFDVYNWGGFVKPAYDFEVATIYGLVGYTETSAHSVSEDGVAYGAGVSTTVADSYELFVDYVRNDGWDCGAGDLVTVGVNYKF